jgi:hypothetical protein
MKMIKLARWSMLILALAFIFASCEDGLIG